MKPKTLFGSAALALVITTTALMAQDGERRPRGERPPPRDEAESGERRRMPPSPLLAVLDTNRDGVIDSAEIEGAPAALRKLDKDGDGKLSANELRPVRPQGEPGKPPTR